MPKALFFDVDGTLIDSYHDGRDASPAVREQLARIQGLGHKLFLSSGRPRMLITPEMYDLGFDGMVLINGGYVEMEGQSVYEERMDQDLARRTIAFLEDIGVEYLLVAARATYMDYDNIQLREFFSFDNNAQKFVYDFDLAEVLSTIIKLEAMVPVPDRARVTALAAEALGPDISCDGHGGAGTYELYPTAISKAKGIEKVLDRLGIGREDAYGFGDGTNDLEMLRYCGLGVAMGNAEDVVKAEADMVCPPVWEDGLAQVLAELF